MIHLFYIYKYKMNLHTRNDNSGRTFKKYYGQHDIPLWADYRNKVDEIPRITQIVKYPYLSLKDARIGTMKPVPREMYHKLDGDNIKYRGGQQEYVVFETREGIARPSKPTQYIQGNFQGNKLKKWTYFAGANQQESHPNHLYHTLENQGDHIRMLAADMSSPEGDAIRAMLQNKKEEYRKPSSYIKLAPHMDPTNSAVWKGKYTYTGYPNRRFN